MLMLLQTVRASKYNGDIEKAGACVYAERRCAWIIVVSGGGGGGGVGWGERKGGLEMGGWRWGTGNGGEKGKGRWGKRERGGKGRWIYEYGERDLDIGGEGSR